MIVTFDRQHMLTRPCIRGKIKKVLVHRRLSWRPSLPSEKYKYDFWRRITLCGALRFQTDVFRFGWERDEKRASQNISWEDEKLLQAELDYFYHASSS